MAATAESEAAPGEESAAEAEEVGKESVEGEPAVEAHSADEPAAEPAAEVEETGEQAGRRFCSFRGQGIRNSVISRAEDHDGALARTDIMRLI